MASVTALTNLTLRDLWREVKDPTTLWGDVSQQTLRTVKLLLENRLHEELADFLHAGFYTRGGSRRGYRNGCYLRQRTPPMAPSPTSRFREIRRRTRPMTCFTNLASCDRIIYAVIYAVIHALNLRRAGRPLSWETTQNS